MIRTLILFLTLAASAFPAVNSVEAVRMTVADLGRSVAFYTGVLQFEREDIDAGQRRLARLRLGSEHIELMQCSEGKAYPAGSRGNDRWFQHVAIIVSDMDRAWRILKDNGVSNISAGPQTIPAWNKAASGIRANYFKDPDGHPLEILWFPAGKGDPKWQDKSRLFLGIDHTAIVVGDTQASLRFYRDTLGMRVAGESLNYGPEQERLSGVMGAKVRITGLRAGGGFGIEFLEYLNPRDGRPAAADSDCDAVHRETVMATTGDNDVLRDPDGHVVRLVSGQSASKGGEQ